MRFYVFVGGIYCSVMVVLYCIVLYGIDYFIVMWLLLLLSHQCGICTMDRVCTGRMN